MPVSKNKRKNGKVAKRVVTSKVLDKRIEGVAGILNLLARATKGRVKNDNETAFRLTVAKGL